MEGGGVGGSNMLVRWRGERKIAHICNTYTCIHTLCRHKHKQKHMLLFHTNNNAPNTYIHIYYTQINTNKHTHTHTHEHMHPHIHTNIHPYTHTYLIHPINIASQKVIHICKTQINTHIDTHPYTHIQTHSHTFNSPYLLHSHCSLNQPASLQSLSVAFHYHENATQILPYKCVYMICEGGQVQNQVCVFLCVCLCGGVSRVNVGVWVGYVKCGCRCKFVCITANI